MTTRDRNARLILAIVESKLHGRDVAQAAGITHSTLSQIINRRRDPRPETIKAIARALKRTPQQLGLTQEVK